MQQFHLLAVVSEGEKISEAKGKRTESGFFKNRQLPVKVRLQGTRI